MRTTGRLALIGSFAAAGVGVALCVGMSANPPGPEPTSEPAKPAAATRTVDDAAAANQRPSKQRLSPAGREAADEGGTSILSAKALTLAVSRRERQRKVDAPAASASPTATASLEAPSPPMAPEPRAPTLVAPGVLYGATGDAAIGRPCAAPRAGVVAEGAHGVAGRVGCPPRRFPLRPPFKRRRHGPGRPSTARATASSASTFTMRTSAKCWIC